ncbi:hypothetical protein BGY98DRAFT_315581 [Russula aff. rugulosa BPL654]|nr:hypothetical protein BGY98DRAFT_315581 [Russula aff. rugulosa BPL654]
MASASPSSGAGSVPKSSVSLGARASTSSRRALAAARFFFLLFLPCPSAVAAASGGGWGAAAFFCFPAAMRYRVFFSMSVIVCVQHHLLRMYKQSEQSKFGIGRAYIVRL